MERMDADEWKAFENFLEKPFSRLSTKQNEMHLLLARRIRFFVDRGGPFTKADLLEDTKLPESANRFDKLASGLYKRLQEFASYRELRSDIWVQERLAFRYYCKQGMVWTEVSRRHKEAVRSFAKLEGSSSASHERLGLELEKGNYVNSRQVPPKERNFEEILERLKSNYLLQKLRLLCATVNNDSIYKKKVYEVDFEALDMEIRTSNDLEPLALTYFYTLRILGRIQLADSWRNLNALLSQFDICDRQTPPGDLNDIYGYLLNHFIRRSNAGDRSALKYLADLMGDLVDRGIILENGRLGVEHFKNLLSAKIKVGAVAEARNYFQRYSGNLLNDPNKSAEAYHEGLLLYAEGKLKLAAQAIENFIEALHGDIKADEFYGLDARANLLKVYFELLEKAQGVHWDEVDQKMERLLDAFESYIARRKLPPHRQKRYEGFRAMTEQCYKACFPGTEWEEGRLKRVLQRELEQNPDREHHRWFLARLRT